MTTSKQRASGQLAPRGAKKTTRGTAKTETKSARSAFHQTSNRDYVKKMTIEVDRDLHTELKMIAAREGVTIRDIVESYLEKYVKTHR